jgi:magnesium transporter
VSQENSPNEDRADALRETLRALFELGSPDESTLRAALSKIAPEDVASILDDFSEKEMLSIFRALPSNEDRSIVLEATDKHSAREILDELEDNERIEVLRELLLDDLADQLEALEDEDQAEQVIQSLGDEDAKEVEELRKFQPDTAGGLMNPDFLWVPAAGSSRQALEQIQGNVDIEVIAYVYVLDDDDVLRGVASIRGLLNAKPETPVAEYMTPTPELHVVSVDTDQEDVAAAVDKYNLPVLPVLDHEGRMKGVVTYDDVIDVVQEEHSEDMLRMAGTVAVHPFHENVWAGVGKRLPFLLVTMIGGLGIVWLLDVFEGAIPQKTRESAMMCLPLLLGLAGNVAIVSSTILVRGLATGEITRTRLLRALGKELLIAMLIGLILGLIVHYGIMALGNLGVDSAAGLQDLAGIPATALFVSVVFVAFLGGIIPILCVYTKRIDPAIASGPFVTMLCDLSVALIFLSLVWLLLPGH